MPNRLAGEASPYLRQHADNPVDWFPWGEEALAAARGQDKPILLSIGYSTCHWCHVMAQESFEDGEIAALMNRHFINIKVDREERPDLDQIYQTAYAMLSQRGGGWPLTLFLTPDQTPFFGGTYFPREGRYNLPGLKELLPQLADFYRTRRGEIDRQNETLRQAFTDLLPRPQPGVSLGAEPLVNAAGQLEQSFDAVNGGFGPAPKFPRPAELELCLRRYGATGDAKALEMARFTLRKIIDGGIFDHLGGGFFRYAVDERWTIPHFEKMLYDNGALLGLCADLWQITGEEPFREAAEETVGWLAREMLSPNGGLYSALDADSGHQEGKFYWWNPTMASALLDPREYAVVALRYGLDQAPNFEARHWHLHVARPLPEVAGQLGLEETEAAGLLAAARARLFDARGARVRPGRDEKILTSWNALTIKGVAHAARKFGRNDWLELAQGAAHFIRTRLWQRGRLHAAYEGDAPRLNGYLDDYAFTLDALLELMQAGFRPVDLDFARELADALLDRFEDASAGGFFFTSHDHEALMHRPKPGLDNATPSGNGVVALALQRLGHLLGEARYLAAAERTLRLFYPAMVRQPAGSATLLMALEEYLAPPRIVVLRGEPGALSSWANALAERHLPTTLVFALPSGLAGLPAILDKPSTEAVNAWMCQGVNCLPPVTDLAALLQACAEPGHGAAPPVI
jgi:uncharacterized protein YyaL (SSP411 family)